MGTIVLITCHCHCVEVGRGHVGMGDIMSKLKDAILATLMLILVFVGEDTHVCLV